MKRVKSGLLFFALAMNGFNAVAAAPSNDELNVGITQEFENLNPLIGNMAATTYMLFLVSRGMVNLTPDGKWVPHLAKSIPTLENKQASLVEVDGKKGLTANWEIIESAKWGDGTPVTCKDLQFAWQAGLNANVNVPSREGYEDIKSIEWKNETPKKCVVTHRTAKWDFYKNLPTPLPAHIEKPVLDKYGSEKEGYDKNSEYTKNPTNPGLYNGPYVISELKLGSHITFTPNAKFYGKQPAIRKITFRLITNTGTLEANLRSGTIDMISPMGLSFDQALDFEQKIKSEKLPYNLVMQPGMTYEHIDFNLDSPKLKDLRVRKALIHAVNKKEITDSLFAGKQKPAFHDVAPMDPWYTEDPKKITIYNYSKREANRLLDEAGYKMGADGYRYKGKEKLSLVFMTTAGNKIRETIQTMLLAAWKNVGVEVVVKNEPARIFFSDTTKKRRYGDMAMYAWVSAPERSPRSVYSSESIPSEKNTWTGQNRMGWVNKKVDKMVGELEVEFNPQKRLDLAHRLLKEYTTDAPVMPFFYRSEIAVVPANMKGYRLAGTLYYETSEVENWDLGNRLR